MDISILSRGIGTMTMGYWKCCLLLNIALCALGIITSVYASEIPEDIRKILDSHKIELRKYLKPKLNRFKHQTTQFSWLPGYIVKRGIERLPNAKKLESFIQKNNLNLIKVPQKYLYQVSHFSQTPSDNNSIILARKINGKTKSRLKFNRKQTQQLWYMVTHVPYYDLHSANMVTNAQEIYIIDTDATAMRPAWIATILSIDWLVFGYAWLAYRPNHPTIQIAPSSCGVDRYTKNALQWLNEKIELRNKWRHIALPTCVLYCLMGVTILCKKYL